jgi:hypothetical protein
VQVLEEVSEIDEGDGEGEGEAECCADKKGAEGDSGEGLFAVRVD